MAGKVKVIIKRADEKVGHMTSISASLKNLQRTVDGYIETVTLPGGLIIICDETGRLKGKPHNCRVDGIRFVGDIIAIGAKGEEFADVPITFQEWKERVE